MGGESIEGPKGRVPGAEKLTFAVVDCSGTLPVLGPDHAVVKAHHLKGHLNCFLGFWAIPKSYPGICCGFPDLVWQKMMQIGADFSLNLRQQKWRAVELFEKLLQECDEMEKKFRDGVDLSEQCRVMKHEAMIAATSMTRALPPAAFPREHQGQRPKDPVANAGPATPPLGQFRQNLQEKAECYILQELLPGKRLQKLRRHRFLSLMRSL